MSLFDTRYRHFYYTRVTAVRAFNQHLNSFISASLTDAIALLMYPLPL